MSAAPERDTPGAPDGAPAPPAPPRFTHEATVRYAETDQMGVCYHANFLLYLEDARTAMFRAHGLPYGDLERRGVALPVRRAEVRYLSPAFYEDVLLVHVRLRGHRAASMTLDYVIERENEAGPSDTIARATIELACIDLATRRPQVFPEDVRRFLERHG